MNIPRCDRTAAAAPNLIVTSRLPDTELWAEVLNLGGRDVLAEPFNPEEVFRELALECRRPDDF